MVSAEHWSQQLCFITLSAFLLNVQVNTAGKDRGTDEVHKSSDALHYATDTSGRAHRDVYLSIIQYNIIQQSYHGKKKKKTLPP
jgi:hypothetical protein